MCVHQKRGFYYSTNYKALVLLIYEQTRYQQAVHY